MKKKIYNHIICSRNDSIIIIECENCGEKQETILFPATINDSSKMVDKFNECLSFLKKHIKCKRKNNVKLLNK